MRMPLPQLRHVSTKGQMPFAVYADMVATLSLCVSFQQAQSSLCVFPAMACARRKTHTEQGLGADMGATLTKRTRPSGQNVSVFLSAKKYNGSSLRNAGTSCFHITERVTVNQPFSIQGYQTQHVQPHHPLLLHNPQLINCHPSVNWTACQIEVHLALGLLLTH